MCRAEPASGGAAWRIRAQAARWIVRGFALAFAGVLAACGALPGSGWRAPITDRPLNLHGACAQTEEDGFREQAVLRVRDSVVQRLEWRLWVASKGGCRFDQADFTQTRTRPQIELKARDGSGCTLMIWQEPRRVTMAHAGCESRCTAGIYDRAWPVMFDPATGGCADTVGG